MIGNGSPKRPNEAAQSAQLLKRSKLVDSNEVLSEAAAPNEVVPASEAAPSSEVVLLAPEEAPAVQQPRIILGDHLRLVACFLPAYRFFGKNTVHSVCKELNTPEFKKNPVIGRKKTLFAFSQSYQTPEAALFILNDETLWNHMGHGERLTLAGMHPTVAQKMMADPTILDTLKTWGWDFAFLGSRNPDLAKEILGDETIFKTMRGDAIAFLGQNDIELAKKILNTPVLRSRLRAHDMPELGKIHLEIAELILKIPLPRKELIALGEYHVEIARKILNTDLKYKLNIEDRFCFAVHPELRSELADQCIYAKDHAKVSQYDAVIAQRKLDFILSNPVILNEASDLIIMSMNHVEIAKQILANPLLRNKLQGDVLAHFCKYHVEIANQFLVDDALKSQLRNIHILGQQHVVVARKIIAENWLNGDQLNDLAANHPSIALQIFANPELLGRFSGRNLTSLAISNVAIAEKCLNDEDLRSKIESDSVVDLQRSVLISSKIKEIVSEVKAGTKVALAMR